MKKQMEAKDLITAGIFTAIYFAVFFIFGMLGYIPMVYALLTLIIPIACGVPYMLFLTKVKCFGMATVMSVLCGGLMVLTGHTVTPLITAAVFGLLADLIFMAGKYASKKCSVIGYSVFSLWIMGMMLPFWIMRDTFETMMLNSMGADYTAATIGIFDKVALLFPLMCIIGGVIGAFFGLAVLKRHFKKAGIA